MEADTCEIAIADDDELPFAKLRNSSGMTERD